MTTIRLSEKWKKLLSELPESGMGYQLVDVRLLNGKILSGLMVLNGEECHSEIAFTPNEIAEISIHQ